MSRSVQYGLPMAIISLLTVVLSIVAMLLNSVVLAVPALAHLRHVGLGRAQLPAARARRATSPRARRTPASTPRSPRPSRAPAPSRRWASRGVRVPRRRRRHRGVGAGRALRHDAAQHALRGAQLRLPDAAGHHAARRRLRLHPRLGRPRPDHRRRPVRRGAGRAARPADRRGRPAPGRRRVDEPAARHRRGAARPRGRRPAARRRRAGRHATSASPTARATTCSTASTCGWASASGWRSSARAARASRRWVACCRASTGPAPARPPSAASSWSTCRSRCCAPRSRSSPRSTTSSSARCATTSCWPARTPTTTPYARRCARSARCSGSSGCPRGSTP